MAANLTPSGGGLPSSHGSLGIVAQPRALLRSKEYTTELGQRRLATDPANKQMVMDLNFLSNSIFGDNPIGDPSTPITYDEFVAQHARLEKGSVEKARADGRHPNPKLCHMCRLVRPLNCTTGKAKGCPGFKLLAVAFWNLVPADAATALLNLSSCPLAHCYRPRKEHPPPAPHRHRPRDTGHAAVGWRGSGYCWWGDGAKGRIRDAGGGRS